MIAKNCPTQIIKRLQHLLENESKRALVRKTTYSQGIERITSLEQLPDFLRAAHDISKLSWQSRQFGLRIRNDEAEIYTLNIEEWIEIPYTSEVPDGNGGTVEQTFTNKKIEDSGYATLLVKGHGIFDVKIKM